MKPVLISLAGVVALVGVGVTLHAGLPTTIAAERSEAAAFLADRCGLTPERLRGASLDRDDWDKIAALSAVMNDNSNVKLTDAMTQLRLFWWGKHGHSDNDQAAYDEENQNLKKVDDLIWEIAGRAAKCGAAYGFVASGR